MPKIEITGNNTIEFQSNSIKMLQPTQKSTQTQNGNITLLIHFWGNTIIIKFSGERSEDWKFHFTEDQKLYNIYGSEIQHCGSKSYEKFSPFLCVSVESHSVDPLHQ